MVLYNAAACCFYSGCVRSLRLDFRRRSEGRRLSCLYLAGVVIILILYLAKNIIYIGYSRQLSGRVVNLAGR